MCGIAGYIGSKKIFKKKIKYLKKMMKRRGPDNQKYFQMKFFKNNMNLFFSRLKILDLNDRANQPYIYKKNLLIFNGEIYNYLEIKKKLIKIGYTFKTTSDTEVLCKALDAWGIKALNQLEGMWAFFYLDKKKNIYLCRDKFGEKPLFYEFSNKGLIFGSEIKYLNALKQRRNNFNFKKIEDFLRYGYKSIFKDNKTFFTKIFSVKPGHYLLINKNLKIKEKKYFDLKTLSIKKNIFKNISSIKLDIINSIKLRLRSDVPIAFLLSGGIDSTSIVNIAKKIYNTKLYTFSIISKSLNFDESKNIKRTINRLNSKHTNIKLNLKNYRFLKNLKEMTDFYHQPVLTMSAMMNREIMKKINKRKFKVSISGIGGDEMFSGYYHHHLVYLNNVKKQKFYAKKLLEWKKFTKPLIRNKFLKKNDFFNNNNNKYKFIYQSDDFKKTLFKKRINTLPNYLLEKKVVKDKFKNRLINELFYEVVPVVLHRDDMNAMHYSIENRSPL